MWERVSNTVSNIMRAGGKPNKSNTGWCWRVAGVGNRGGSAEVDLPLVCWTGIMSSRHASVNSVIIPNEVLSSMLDVGLWALD